MAIIKKHPTTLWTKMKEKPNDWMLHLLEDISLLDWNKISDTISWPLALLFNLLFILISLLRQFIQPTPEDILDPSGTMPSRWPTVLLISQIGLFCVSLANTWWCFHCRRVYQLRKKDVGSQQVTSNFRLVSLGSRSPWWAHNHLWGQVVWGAWKWVRGIDDRIHGQMWELSLWVPPTFGRNLFCWFSPIQVLVLSFVDFHNLYFILPLAAVLAGQLTFVVMEYARLVRDKEILFGEMYNEYNQGFVNPRVFAKKQERGTSTMEDWAEDRRRRTMLSGSGNVERTRGNRYSGYNVRRPSSGRENIRPVDPQIGDFRIRDRKAADRRLRRRQVLQTNPFQ